MKKYEIIKLRQKRKKKIAKKMMRLNTIVTVALLLVAPAFAVNSNTNTIDPIITFLCDWFFKIGLVTALTGGVTFGFGFANDQQDLKSKGLMIMTGGFMVAAIAKSPDIFGL